MFHTTVWCNCRIRPKLSDWIRIKSRLLRSNTSVEHDSPSSFQPSHYPTMDVPSAEFLGGVRAWTLIVSCCLVMLVFIFRKMRRSLSLPPGPRGLPILGNVLDMPNKTPWLTYCQWGKEYSRYPSLRNRECTLHLGNDRF